MLKEHKVTSAAYRKIAIDIAQNIADGAYAEGQKLFGRSVLASAYRVSPETIRKAVYILKDVGILETEKGSGIKVKSSEKAKEFVKLQSEIDSVTKAKNEVISWAKGQVKEISELVERIQFIADAAERQKSAGPFAPYELRITGDAAVIGKTTDELRFWHNTGATIIAIRRDERLILSPGPYAAFYEDDVFYMIGDESAYYAAVKLIFGGSMEKREQTAL